MLLVRQAIIHTTYCSTIVKTHVFRLYYHLWIYVPTYLCINIATHLHMIYLDWLKSVLQWKWRCAWHWWSSELRDTLWGHDRASLEMDLEAVKELVGMYGLGGHDRANMEAVIVRVSRYAWMPWSSKFRDMHLEAMIVQTWRLQSSNFGVILGSHIWAYMEVVIVRVWRSTWRPWLCKPVGYNRASLDEYLQVVNGQRARRRDCFHLLVNSQPLECDNISLRFSYHGRLADGARSCRKAHWKLKLDSGVNS